MTKVDATPDTVASKFGLDAAYEEAQFAFASQTIKSHGIRRFIDVGANKGVYGYFANEAIRNGQIIMVEANPELAKELELAVKTWPEHGNQITVHNVAASDAHATMPFYKGDEDVHGTMTQKNPTGHSEAVFVQCLPLDEIVQGNEPTILKCDVEGFEYRALRGSSRILLSSIAIVELHGWGDPQIGRYPFHVLRWLISRGFVVKRIGSSFAFSCEKGTILDRIVCAGKYLPYFFAKYLLRRSGLRRLIRTD